jgi:hypothetical protein
MEPDFSGWATKAGLRCSDGRTILPDAFKDQDKMKVPLVWQHGHNDAKNVLGHAILENRGPSGVYAYCYFNNTPQAKSAKEAVRHQDIDRMSIWANELIQKGKSVYHGVIREVSLVLSAANPGAIIENVHIRHSSDEGDDWEEVLEDQVIIHTDTPLEKESPEDDEVSNDDNSENDNQNNSNENDDSKNNKETDGGQVAHEKTVQEVYDSMTEEQQEVLHAMVGEALGENSLEDDGIEHATGNGNSGGGNSGGSDPTVQDVYDSMTPVQQEVLHYMIGEALQAAGTSGGNSAAQSAMNDDGNDDGNKDEKGDDVGDGVVKHNVFENGDENTQRKGILSHDALNEIIGEACKSKSQSLMGAFKDYALAHGIDDIDLLFPEAVSIDDTPQLLSRRTEWVQVFLPATRKVPFSRIKSVHFDLTFEEARAKGYVKGALKKEEFIKAARRITTPTTVYKKQKLDRDDVVDITEFDVVAFLQAEMRLMLDEEVARAALLGDGRAADDEDKISEDGVRPIVSDDEMYVTQVNVNINDANSDASEIVDAVISHRQYLKGTGMPTFFTKESVISKFLVLKDTLGRRIYNNIDEVATALRVSAVVPVEVMEEYPSVLGIIVNPADYTYGATKGGEISSFDQFDIDYNQHKYLIETRVAGALTKLKSALVLNGEAGTSTLVVPTPPTFDPATGELTITNTANVVYTNADTAAVLNNAGSPYTVASGDTIHVHAEAAAGHYVEDSVNDDWYFTAD